MHGGVLFIEFKRASRFAWILFFLSGLLWSGSALAMDRFAALSMIESGDYDFARGQHTEVSRYQIRREVWMQATNAPLELATNAAVALDVARVIAEKRCLEFEKKHGRTPTDFEFYVLWNAPTQIDNPGRAVRKKAERFVNLIQKPD
jgi:hypothetical protein